MCIANKRATLCILPFHAPNTRDDVADDAVDVVALILYFVVVILFTQSWNITHFELIHDVSRMQ